MIAELDWRLALLLVGAIVVVAGGASGLLVTSPHRNTPHSTVRVQAQNGIQLSSAIRSRPFVLLLIGFLLASFGQFTPIAHLVPYAEDQGISPKTAPVLLSLLGIGRFAVGAAAVSIGRWRGLGLSFGGVGVSCILWLTSDGMIGLGVFAVLVGTFWGGSVALAPSVMADYFGTRAVSGIIGVLYTGVGLGALVGPIIAGFVFDLWQSYTVAIIYSIVVPAFAAVSVLSAESPERWRLRHYHAGESAAQDPIQPAGYAN